MCGRPGHECTRYVSCDLNVASAVAVDVERESTAARCDVSGVLWSVERFQWIADHSGLRHHSIVADCTIAEATSTRITDLDLELEQPHAVRSSNCGNMRLARGQATECGRASGA